jgi:ABC-type glycerol-3-phosphate transport system permease component
MNVWRRDYFLPAVLVVVGVYFLLRNTGLLDWLGGDVVWPVLLIVLGVWLIVRRPRT